MVKPSSDIGTHHCQGTRGRATDQKEPQITHSPLAILHDLAALRCNYPLLLLLSDSRPKETITQLTLCRPGAAAH